MKISVLTPNGNSQHEVLQDFADKLAGLENTPSLVLLHGNTSVLKSADMSMFAQMPPLHAATSCLGAMSQHGHQTDMPFGVTAFCIHDPAGDYGTAFAPIEDAFESGATAVETALSNAGRKGEAPDAIWISVSPGQEEAILAGIESVVGNDVPIIGGSAADNDVSGNWWLFDNLNGGSNGVIVSVLFASTEISVAYQNGYAPTKAQGTVTKVEGRKIMEIDHKPATSVYYDWSNYNGCPEQTNEPHSILAQATLWPLGRRITDVHGIPYYLLAHPAVAHPDGAIEVFADVEEGETLTQMHGTTDGLAERAGRVATQAAQLSSTDAEIAGALVVYCGGCMLSVQDKMDRVVDSLTTALPDTPFLGAFTFGEQGPIVNAGNRHGNLMISSLVFHS